VVEGAGGVTMGRRLATTGQDAARLREARAQDRLAASTVITTGGMTALLAAVIEGAGARALPRTSDIGAPDFWAHLPREPGAAGWHAVCPGVRTFLLLLIFETLVRSRALVAHADHQNP
jgi:hypothetical protein